MKKSTKIYLVIFLIALSIFLCLLIFFSYKSYKETSELYFLLSNESLKSDFQRLLEGDCSKSDIIRNNILRMEELLNKSCKNLISRKVISKYYQRDICTNPEEIDNLLLDIDRIRTICINFSPYS